MMRTPLPSIRYETATSDPELAEQEIEAAKARDQSTHDFFSGLSAALQEQLTQQMSEQPFYSQLHVDTGMSPEGRIVQETADLPLSAQESLTRFVAGVSPAKSTDSVYVALRFGGGGVRATLLDAAGKSVGEMLESIQAPPLSAAMSLDHRGLPEQAKRLGRNTPPSWNELVAYQTSRVWKNNVPVQPPSVDGPPPYRPGVLTWLADKGNLEFVADYYSRPFKTWSETDQKQPLTQPLKAELDFRAAEQDMSWKQAGGIYLFRDNRWYRDDELEVAASLLKRWTAELAEQDRTRPQSSSDTPVPAAFAKRVLRLRAEMVDKLTPWQIVNGLKYATLDTTANNALTFGALPAMQSLQLPFGNVADLLMDNLHTLRFYQGLEEQQRDELLAGQLVYDTLSGSEKQQAVYVQGLLRIARKKEQRILLGLVPRLREVHAYYDASQWGYTWPNRTGIGNVILNITSPHFSAE